MIKNIIPDDLDYLYKKINHCLYLTDKNTVIKNCLESCNNPDLISERLEYVSSLPDISGYTKPLNLISNGDSVYGYEMKYLDGYKTLMSCLKEKVSELDFADKKKICMNLIKTIKELNKFYYVGDINLNNIMVNKNGDSSIIDWENGTPNSFNYGMLCAYALMDINSFKGQDAFKIFISVISFLYGVNFEIILPYMSVDIMEETLKKIKLDDSIISYISDVNSMIMSGSKEAIYFDEYLKDMKPISSRKVGKVKKKILTLKDLY